MTRRLCCCKPWPSLWSRHVRDECVSRACALANEHGIDGGVWAKAMRTASVPCTAIRTLLPHFNDPRLEHVFATYTANETNSAFAMFLCALMVGLVVYASQTDLTTIRSTSALVCSVVLTSCALLLLAMRTCMQARAQLWMRTALAVLLSTSLHAGSATNPDTLEYYAMILIWSNVIKVAVSLGDVGWLRAMIVNGANAVMGLLLVFWLRPLETQLQMSLMRWELIVTIAFSAAAFYNDLHARTAFLQLCEIHALRTYSRTSSQLHRHVVNSAADMLCVHTLPGMETVYVSRVCEPLLGLTQGEVRGRTLFELTHAGDAHVIRALAGSCADEVAALSSSSKAQGGYVTIHSSNADDIHAWTSALSARRASSRVAPEPAPPPHPALVASSTTGLQHLHALDSITDDRQPLLGDEERYPEHGERLQASERYAYSHPPALPMMRAAPSAVTVAASTTRAASRQLACTSIELTSTGAGDALQQIIVSDPPDAASDTWPRMDEHYDEEVVQEVDITVADTGSAAAGAGRQLVGSVLAAGRLRRYPGALPDANWDGHHVAAGVALPWARAVSNGPAVFTAVQPRMIEESDDDDDDAVVVQHTRQPEAHARIFTLRWRRGGDDNSYVPLQVSVHAAPEGVVCSYRFVR